MLVLTLIQEKQENLKEITQHINITSFVIMTRQETLLAIFNFFHFLHLLKFFLVDCSHFHFLISYNKMHIKRNRTIDRI